MDGNLLNIKNENEYGENTYIGTKPQAEESTMQKTLRAINKLKKSNALDFDNTSA